MRTILSEKAIVIALFIIALVTFSLAQEDSEKMEQTNAGVRATVIPYNPPVAQVLTTDSDINPVVKPPVIYNQP